MNPWNLTERDREVLDSLVEHGSNKAVANWLGMTDRSVEAALHRIAKRMGLIPADRVRMAVTYDRWARSQEETA